MIPRRPSGRRTCNDEACTLHRWPLRKGLHGCGRLVIPTDGDVRGLVMRRWDDSGRHEAYIRVRDDGVWSQPQPLPRRPRKVYADAVAAARRFLAEVQRHEPC